MLSFSTALLVPIGHLILLLDIWSMPARPVRKRLLLLRTGMEITIGEISVSVHSECVIITEPLRRCIPVLAEPYQLP